MADVVADKALLKANGYSAALRGRADFCFAGDDDELVIASSPSNPKLYVWSVPVGQGNRTIDQPMLSLSGHQRHRAVRYSKAVSTLASGDEGGSIKLWTRPTGC